MKVFMNNFLAVIIFQLLIFPICFAQTTVVRKKINFDEDWKFHLGNEIDPAKDFNFRIANIFSQSGNGKSTAVDPLYNDSGWRHVQLPHDWVAELPFVKSANADLMNHGYKPVGGLFPETSVGWYRKHFMMARSDSGHRFRIQFDGIFRDASVWLNGLYLGNNLSGYIGVSYDITDYLDFERENVLVIRVDASQYEGWFYEGAGIYRHVWLNEYNNVFIPADGVFVYTEVKGKSASVHIKTNIENKNLKAEDLTLYSYVTDRNGKKIAQGTSRRLALEVGEMKLTDQIISVINPRLWSLEDPYLFRVISLIRSGSKAIDSVVTRFGIRTITIDASNGLFLNGKKIKIKGVCCHQDHAGVGSALPDYLQYYRVRLLKDLGANAYRTSHHPPTPELLDACDSIGMLVLDEQRLLNSGTEYISQFQRMIIRDRNHPSVFMWCLGNEEGYIQTNSTGKRIAQALLTQQKLLDPSRTSTYAANVGNTFRGVNEVIPVRGFNYHHSSVEDYHKDHPGQPIIGTEMGSTVTTRGIYEKDTIRGYVPDQDITAPSWASKAETWWPLAADHDFWLGGFVWTGFDYRGEPTPYQWPNINSHFGIMDVCGFPKNIYYYYQSWWSDKDVLHISPHWNWKGREGKPIDVWVNSNADNIELFLNGRTQGKKDMPKNSHLQWNVIYEPGILEAVGYKNGKKIRSKIETTGEPYEVIITPYKTTMIADGKDVTVINVRVIDRQAREVPNASNQVKFSITGDAKIIGVGNGDPSSHEPDQFTDGWERKLFNGKCQLILKAGKTAGIIKVEVTSENLQTGSTEIHTIQPGMAHLVSNDKKFIQGNLLSSKKQIGKMLGADISFLPQLEERGMKFYDRGEQKDAIRILKDHGFNYIRLRIFNNPAADSGYSPKKGFCDLDHTKLMAKRIKDAGLKFLLDFHFSDYWADPGKQFKPSAWRGLSFLQLKNEIYDYTKNVIEQLKSQGTAPDMVQVGNEINHGIVWPEGHVGNLDSLAQLINAATAAIREINPSTIIMMHVALGGQHDESVFFLDNMLARGVVFDVIGESYYPKWHGTLEDLRNNLTELANRYTQDIVLVEYSQLKREVSDIIFNLPKNKGKGTCIWEPLNTWESIFDRNGKSNELLNLYDEIKTDYHINE